MNEKIKIELGSVQKTLLLPLWGRAVETKKSHPLLKDITAAEIINKIDYDFSTINANINKLTQLAWIARSIHFDEIIKNFLSVHPYGTIVNLGCGLDTTYERVNNGKLSWYDLDLPDVICLKKRFFNETENRRFISASLHDEDWISLIENRERVLFTAAGVFYYFEEDQVRNFFNMIAKEFNSAELVFDALTPGGLKITNKKVIEESGMDRSAFVKWSIESSVTLTGWHHNIEILEEFPLFRRFKKSLSIKEKIGTVISDLLKVMFIVHLRFGQ